MGRRAAKRAEDRDLAREFAAAASWYDSTEGKRWLERGSPCGSEQCTFICHEVP